MKTNVQNVRTQRGATLLIALVMLLVLTVLGVTSMRGVTLESRATASRVALESQQQLADAATREGEFRFYGPAYIQDKLEPNPTNCTKDNKLNRNGHNKPCLIRELSGDDLARFFSEPISFLTRKGADTDGAGDSDALDWMPYRGLDYDPNRYYQGDNAYWNAYRVMGGAEDNETINPEYGDALEGRGTYFFLVNGQTGDEVAIQSTIAVIYQSEISD